MAKQGEESQKGFRADIQGLRAVAVLLVVAEHFIGKPHGAFVGLEFFFVISGFLITGLLLREGDRTKRISIAKFYRRRIRRIMPAALVALAAIVIASRLILTMGRYQDVKSDAWWSLISAVNWHFIADGTNYFHPDGAISPLRHYWSLAVEEQFYVAWPLAVLGLVFYSQHRRRLGKPISLPLMVGALAVVVMVVSFVYALSYSASNPTAAYFSTFTRAWEIAVGCLLACNTRLLSRLPTLARNVMGVVGLVGIVVSALTLNPDVGFPAPTGALPVLSAALIVASGVGVERVLVTRWMTIPPLQYVGNASFSLYLCHWPVLIFMDALRDKHDMLFYDDAIALTVVSTLMLHHLVELPVMRSKFLMTWKPRVGQPATRWRGAWQPHNITVVITSLAVVAAVAFVGQSSTASSPPSAVQSAVARARHALGQAGGGGVSVLQDSLKRSLRKSSYPASLSPALGDVTAGEAPQMLPSASCLNPADITDVDQCNYGPADAPKLAVVFGDSVSMAYLPGLIEALTKRGYRIHGMALGNCPAADVQVRLPFSPQDQQRCNTSHQLEYDTVNALHPDLVIMADSASGIERLLSGNRGHAATAEWAQGSLDALQAVSAPHRKVVILAPNPTGPDPAVCVSVGSTPDRCDGPVQDWYDWKRTAEEAAARHAGATYVDTSQWFCYHDECPIFALGLTMRWDGSHITAAYSELLAGSLRRAILGAHGSGGAVNVTTASGP